MKVLLAVIVAVALMSECCTGLRTPAYLYVPHFKDCLATKNVGSAQFWCVPAAKPDNCPAASWQQLVADGELSKCL
jgi:hypothetical protein